MPTRPNVYFLNTLPWLWRPQNLTEVPKTGSKVARWIYCVLGVVVVAKEDRGRAEAVTVELSTTILRSTGKPCSTRAGLR